MVYLYHDEDALHLPGTFMLDSDGVAPAPLLQAGKTIEISI